MSYSESKVWDWESIGAVAHGVGASSDYLFKCPTKVKNKNEKGLIKIDHFFVEH